MHRAIWKRDWSIKIDGNTKYLIALATLNAAKVLLPGVAEQLGGGWPSRGQTGAWLKRRAVLHVARRDVFVSVMTLLDEQTIRTENVQYLSDSSISNHRR